jgi:hypothetical protein
MDQRTEAPAEGGDLTPNAVAARSEAPEGERASRWEDYVDIYLSPAEVFRRRANDAAGPPLATLLVLSTVLYLVLIPANRAIIAASAQADPNTAAFMEDWGTILQIVGVVAVPITMIVMVAFAAMLLWLAARLFGVPLEPGRAFLISVFAGFVLLVGQVAAAGLVMLHPGGAIDISRDLSLGALRFYPAGEVPAATVAILRRIDVFAVWQAVLWGVGVRIVAGTTAGRAALIAFAAWLLLAVPSLLMAIFGPTAGS